jgi:hypothetical protein
MAKPITGTTPVEGRCVYCGAGLVLRWVERWAPGNEHPTRITEGPFCANGHPQPMSATDEPTADE